MNKQILCKKHLLEPSRFGSPSIFVDRDRIEWIELFNSGKGLEYRAEGVLKNSRGVEGYTVKVEGELPIHILKNSDIDEEYEKRKE